MSRGLAAALCTSIALLACDSGTQVDSGRANASASVRNGSDLGVLHEVVDAGYARARQVRPFEFPADHGPHEDFRSEWWYFTGNLQSTGGRRFGFQLTLFRLALAPPPTKRAKGSARPRSSRFATRQAWMGHFALTDVDGTGSEGGARRHGGGPFYAFERLERGAAGLAGAGVQPFRVWIRDWQISALYPNQNELFPLRLRAAEGGISVDLTLERGKPLVLQGEAGLSRKSSAPGNASYYYSFTRLPASGHVRSADGKFPVSGLVWFDREWGSSTLAADQRGWDWFALQLDDGRELMVYRLRNEHGGTHPFSAGTLVAADGSHTPLGVEQMRFEPGRTWRSPQGTSYPVEWTLRAGSLQLQISALADAQAHSGRFRYWEGAVQARGRDGKNPVSARGYLEMTGYQQP